MFGSVLEKLDGWFGQSFIVASLLPVLMFGGANILMLQFLFPETLKATLAYFASWPFAPLGATAALLIVCAILAYATDPWAQLTINVLRGVKWPKSLSALGVADQNNKLRAIEEDMSRSAALRRLLTEKRCEALKTKLIDARVRGIAVGAISKATTIPDAERAVHDIEQVRDRGETITMPALEKATDALAAALAVNCANPSKLEVADLRSGVEEKQCERLGELFDGLKELIDYARKRGKSGWTAAVNRRNSEMPRTTVAPTQLGNSFAALDDYLDEIFAIDIDFFLPIIRMIVAKDKDASGQLGRAQQRLDFAARTLVLVILFTAIWLTVLVVSPKSGIAVAVVGTGGVIVGTLVIEVIKASFDSYSETIRAVCILKRFDVLTALHMKLPGDWATEQSLWKLVNEQLQWGSAKPNAINYEHPAK